MFASKRQRSPSESADSDSESDRDESEYIMPAPTDKGERDLDNMMRKRRRYVHGDDDRAEDVDDGVSREQWTHLPSGAAMVYPLSLYLDPEPVGRRGGGGGGGGDDDAADPLQEDPLRLVMFRVNAGSAVAPFLEFALVRDREGSSGHLDWPKVEPTNDATVYGKTAAEEEEQDDDQDAASSSSLARQRRVRASDAVYALMDAVPGVPGQPPRFCGAWRGGGPAEYCWFQVDPSSRASSAMKWVTVHDLVKAGAVGGERLRADIVADFASQPLLWCICDADRQVPVEIPVSLEPLAFRPPAAEDGDDLFALETDADNYETAARANAPNNHLLFGHTMFAFHDPHWPAFLAARDEEEEEEEEEEEGNDNIHLTSGGMTPPPKRYAVFLHETLYLIGDCPRENAALLAFADDTHRYTSVYLPMNRRDEFVWLVKRSDQFVALSS